MKPLAVLAACLPILAGCLPAGTPSSSAALDASACVLLTAAADVAKGGLTPLAIVLDTVATCRVSELQAAKLLEAHAAAASAVTPAQARAMVDVARAHAAAAQ